VVERDGLHAKGLLVEDAAGRQGRRGVTPAAKGLPGPELGRTGDAVRLDLVDDEAKVDRVGTEQVPRVGAQPVLDLVDDPRRSD
jgi:hypothetical protein